MQKTENKESIKAIALERIYRLFELAEKEFKKHKERSNRYVNLAWKISLRYKVKIPLELKTKFCRKCRHYLKKEENCTINELKDLGNKLKLMEIECFNCGYKRKTKAIL